MMLSFIWNSELPEHQCLVNTTKSVPILSLCTRAHAHSSHVIIQVDQKDIDIIIMILKNNTT